MKLLNKYRPGSKRLQADPSVQFSNNRPWLYLLRHGQIQGHDRKRFIGQTDIPLDKTGQDQALFWKKSFAHIQFEKIYTSSLLRCQNTADLICPGKKIQVDIRLNEINLGTWDGKPFDHIQKTYPDLFEKRGKEIESFRPPGGESFNDLYNRVSPFFEAINQDLKKPCLVITHSGVIRVMVCKYLGMDPSQLFKIKLGYSHLFLLEN
jgi:alpha-ribazole phosphatase